MGLEGNLDIFAAFLACLCSLCSLLSSVKVQENLGGVSRA